VLSGYRVRQRLRGVTGVVAPERRAGALLVGHPRLARAGTAAGCAAVALAFAGPIAGLLAGVYSGLAVHLVQRRELRRQELEAESAAMDAVVTLAADLRAGQPPGRALAAVAAALDHDPSTVHRGSRAWSGRVGRRQGGAGTPVGRSLGAVGTTARSAGGSQRCAVVIRQRVRAAVRVAEVAGAPLADLLDRLDADLRARRLVALHSAAQAAGATATSALLAALPVAGIGLGYALGVDPGHQLLHTRLGAGCVLAALALQLAGLAWVGRIARGATEPSG
jgi:tight adherence protein B